ncbi:MAG: RraA family protein [Candidatus Parcubacteria bacterium]|nr:RraA family protein [Burkholderiales bacterium]
MSQPLAVLRQRLFASVLSDCLDAAGYRAQAMQARIRPLDQALVLCGRARTALYMDVYDAPEGENPYELEIRLIDDLKPDEVAVFACGASGRIAPWGELLSTAARVRGAAGVVMDGLTRDVRAIREMKFPVFAAGIGPLDSKGRGKVISIDAPVEVAGARVAPGDLVFGDVDGVVVVPRAVEDQVIAAALAKVAGENTTREALARGEKLADVFKRHGIL